MDEMNDFNYDEMSEGESQNIGESINGEDTGESEEIGETSESEEQIQKVSPLKLVVILSLTIILIIIILFFIRGCSIQKTVPREGTMGVVEKEKTPEKEDVAGTISSSGVDVSDKVSEELKNEGVSLEVSGEDYENSGEHTLKPVNNVKVLNTYTNDVLVSSKNIFLLDDTTYAYSLRLIVPIENQGYRLVDYLCSVATWNSVESKDSITVQYGIDESGRVIIIGLAKTE